MTPTASTSFPPDVDTLTTGIAWLDAGHDVQLVTVASTWGSAPRPAGSIAVVRDDGAVAGSVSGGCIERQLAERRASRVGAGSAGGAAVESIAVPDEAARHVGLTCGGRLELVFETIDAVAPLQRIVDALLARERIVRELDVDTGRVRIREALRDDVFAWDGQRLIRPFGPDWRLLLVGAGELSRQVARIASMLDFDVVICEPRAPFRAAMDVAGVRLLDLLPDDAVLAHATDAHSAVLALAHDPELDDLALQEALAADCFHIGALGSRRSHEKRVRRLLAIGVQPASLDRISAPVGLDIGSRTAAEIAVSIAAELVQARVQARTQMRTLTRPVPGTA